MTDNLHLVGACADIEPGTVKRIKIGDTDIGVYNIDGEYFAIDDICTHMRARLSAGYITDDVVECPVHFGKFNIKTGAACGAPCTEDLETYAVEIKDDSIFVAFD